MRKYFTIESGFKQCNGANTVPSDVVSNCWHMVHVPVACIIPNHQTTCNSGRCQKNRNNTSIRKQGSKFQMSFQQSNKPSANLTFSHPKHFQLFVILISNVTLCLAENNTLLTIIGLTIHLWGSRLL